MKWKSSTLGEIVANNRGLVQTGPFGSQLHQSDYTSEGTPVIMPTDIGDGRVSVDRIARVSEETASRLSRHKLKQRTIVLPRRGAITKRAFIRDDQEGWLCGSGCLKIEVQDTELLPEFLYYYMDQHRAVQWLEQHAVGSTMLNLSAGIVNQFPVRYPNVEDQSRIASILSAYDDLIENNRRRMALLEKAARLLYEEWFVRLRFPGHEHTRITDGVPEGWEKRPLGKCAIFQSGGTPSKSRDEFWDGDIPWVSSGEMTTPRIRDANLHISEAGAADGSRLVPADTILAVVRGMSLAKEFRVAITSGTVAFNQDLKALIARDGIDPAFLFAAIVAQRDQIRERSTEASHGTKKLDTAVLSEVQILVPPLKWQQRFRDIVDPMNAQWDNLHAQNQKLRAARDLLLPRLMSGEIEV